DVQDGRQGHDERRNLGDAEDQHDHRQHTRPGNPGDQQGQADEDGLDQGDPDHPLGDGTNGRRGQAGKCAAAGAPDDALEDGLAATTPRLPKGHDDAGNDEGADELQQSATDAGDEAQGGF